MFSHPRYHGPNRVAWDRRNDVHWAVRTLTRALEAVDHRPDWRERSWRPANNPDGSGEASPGCLSEGNLEDHSQESPSQHNGGRIFMDMPLGEGIGSVKPQELAVKTGDPKCCPGEALRWQLFKYPGGTNLTSGKRGGLVGSNPEALCGEAPEGQPEIRR